MDRPAARVTGGAALVALLVGGTAAGCTDPEAPDAPPERPAAEGAALRIDVVGGAASMSPEDRDRFVDDVGDVLTTYVVDGFLGDHPRSSYLPVLDAFSRGAAPRAVDELEELTLAGSPGATGVVARTLEARVSGFAPRGEASGASAAVSFVFDVTRRSGTVQRVALRGRLMLTPERDGWRIFGYDVELVDEGRPSDRGGT